MMGNNNTLREIQLLAALLLVVEDIMWERIFIDEDGERPT